MSEEEQKFDRGKVRERLYDEARKAKIAKAEGVYEFDNEDLEYKSGLDKKVDALEQKYKDMPKIVFHELSDEGNRLFMQAQRDRIWTTLQFSFVGNFVGVGAVRVISNRGKNLQGINQIKSREVTMALAFVGCIGMFTAIGYDKARREFIKSKRAIVDKHGLAATSK